MDLHKETHTAVLVNCWNKKLHTVVIANKPGEFSKLTKAVTRIATKYDLEPIYGLENQRRQAEITGVGLHYAAIGQYHIRYDEKQNGVQTVQSR